MAVTLLPDEQSRVLVRLEDLHSLSEARITGADLVLRPLREAQVISLAMGGQGTWPPIMLTRTKEHGLLVIDGYHRWEAAKRRKFAEILADIRAFPTENDMIEAAFTASITYGLPASASTRSDYAYWLWRTYPDIKQVEIAQRVGLRPPTVHTAIKRRERERRAAEAEQKRRDSLIGLRKEDQEREDRLRALEKERAQAIRAYVRASRRLYDALRRLDDDGERYWALSHVIDEGDKVMLFRLTQYVDKYLKENLPQNLTKSLKPTASRRTKKASDASLEEGQDAP
jgi:hypothetical protein